MYLNKINLALLKTKYLNKLSFSVGGAFGFSPLDLFKNGEQGVWYDPSDLSTLFQDAAGTTPVTTDGDPVGLMLDKSQGLKQGEEIISDGMFESGLSEWRYTTFDGTNGVTLEGGSARVRSAGAAASTINQLTGAIQGKSYLITFWTDKLLNGGHFRLGVDGRLRTFESGTTEEILQWDGGDDRLYFSRNGGTDFYLDNVSVKEFKGNHATQSVSTSRPTYRTDGTLHWLEFDGVDDYLEVKPFAEAMQQPYSFVAGVQRIASGGSTSLVDCSVVDTRFAIVDLGAVNYVTAGSPRQNTLPASSGVKHVLAVFVSGIDSKMQSGKEAIVTANIGSNPINNILIATRDGRIGFSQNNLYGVLYVKGAIEDVGQVQDYLASKSGVTL